jgi:hypothetical protein
MRQGEALGNFRRNIAPLGKLDPLGGSVFQKSP